MTVRVCTRHISARPGAGGRDAGSGQTCPALVEPGASDREINRIPAPGSARKEAMLGGAGGTVHSWQRKPTRGTCRQTPVWSGDDSEQVRAPPRGQGGCLEAARGSRPCGVGGPFGKGKRSLAADGGCHRCTVGAVTAASPPARVALGPQQNREKRRCQVTLRTLWPQGEARPIGFQDFGAVQTQKLSVTLHLPPQTAGALGSSRALHLRPWAEKWVGILLPPGALVTPIGANAERALRALPGPPTCSIRSNCYGTSHPSTWRGASHNVPGPVRLPGARSSRTHSGEGLSPVHCAWAGAESAGG